MVKLVKETLYEAVGAGFSQSSGFRGGFGGFSRGGFGGGSNLGSANTMYTYEIKPLTHTLEQPTQSLPNSAEEIKIGSKIIGHIIPSNAYPNKNRKIIGIVINIIYANNNALKYYVVQDEATQKQVRVSPIGVELVVNDNLFFDENEIDSLSRRNEKIRNRIGNKKIVKENLNEKLTIQEQTDDVKGKVIRSKKIPKELKEKIIPLLIKRGIHGSYYRNGIVGELKYPSSKGVSLGADKNGFFVFTHRARSKSYPEIDKIPQSKIDFIKSTG